MSVTTLQKITLMALWALVVGAVTVFLAQSPGQHHDRGEGVDVYRYPPALLRAVLTVVPIPAVCGALIYWSWTPSGPTRHELFFLFLVFGGGTVAAFLGYQYCKALRVELSDVSLTIRSWLTERTTALTDLIDLNVVDTRSGGKGGGRYLDLYLSSGGKLRITGALMDFDDLAASLAERIPEHADCPEKIRDMAAMARNNRRANVLMVVGLGIVAITVLVMWRLGLL